MNQLDTRIKKESRIAGLISLAGFLVVIGFFVFSFLELQKLNTKLESKKMALDSLDFLIGLKTDSIEIKDSLILIKTKSIQDIVEVVDRHQNGKVKDSVNQIVSESQVEQHSVWVDYMQRPAIVNQASKRELSDKVAIEKPAMAIEAPVNKPVIVFIQVSNPELSGKLKRSGLHSALVGAGFKVPGYEVKPRGCDNTIRYFFKEDEEAANRIKTITDANLGEKLELKFIPSLAKVAKPNQVEIWVK